MSAILRAAAVSAKGPASNKKTAENFLKTALNDFEKNLLKIHELSWSSYNNSREVQWVKNKNDNIVTHLRGLMDHADNGISQQANEVLIKVQSKQFQANAAAMPSMPGLPTKPPPRPTTPVPMPALPDVPQAITPKVQLPEATPVKAVAQKSEKKSFFQKIAARFVNPSIGYDNKPENTAKRVKTLLKKGATKSLQNKFAELQKQYGIQPGESSELEFDKILNHFGKSPKQVKKQVKIELNLKKVELASQFVAGKVSLEDANVQFKQDAESIIENAKDKIYAAYNDAKGGDLAVLEYSITKGALDINKKMNKKIAIVKINEAQKDYNNYDAAGNMGVFRSGVGMGMLNAELATEIEKQSPKQPAPQNMSPVPNLSMIDNGNSGFILTIDDDGNVIPNSVSTNGSTSATPPTNFNAADPLEAQNIDDGLVNIGMPKAVTFSAPSVEKASNSSKDKEPVKEATEVKTPKHK